MNEVNSIERNFVGSDNRKGRAFPFTSVTAEVKALSDHEPKMEIMLV